MPSVVHVITTDNFAGAERYVCNVARETTSRGWDTAIVGGDTERMSIEAGMTVRCLPGANVAQALLSLARLGRHDVCHTHLTLAEAVGVAAWPLHRAPVVSTRHIAAPRGSSHLGRRLAPWISRRLAREFAVSDFVARRVERSPDAVIESGVPLSPCLWRSASQVVLVLQRLEPEKDTLTALRAWRTSRLWEEGWSLRIVGEGSERGTLEAWVVSREVPNVTFGDWTSEVSTELAGAGIVLAPARSDSFGLTVVEAMAAGVPVVACAAGGHLETVGLLPNAPMFPPGDADRAATALRSLVPESARSSASKEGWRLVKERLSVARHVDTLLLEYEAVRRSRGAPESAGRDLTAGQPS